MVSTCLLAINFVLIPWIAYVFHCGVQALDFSKDSGPAQNVVVESYGKSEMDETVEKKSAYVLACWTSWCTPELYQRLLQAKRSAEKLTACMYASFRWSLGVSNLFKRLSGSKVLDAHDLQEPMEAMKNKLVAKNVASDIADQVCESVKVKLLGQKVGTFNRTATLVNDALRSVRGLFSKAARPLLPLACFCSGVCPRSPSHCARDMSVVWKALVRILTPNKSIDVLRSALEAKVGFRRVCDF